VIDQPNLSASCPWTAAGEITIKDRRIATPWRTIEDFIHMSFAQASRFGEPGLAKGPTAARLALY
jgi:hypothetical protein